MEFLQIPGVFTFTGHTFITPTNSGYAFRIFHVNFQGTVSTSALTLCDVRGGSTATALTTAPIITCSGDSQGRGDIDIGYGVRFINGVFIQTHGSLTFGSVTYCLEKK